MGGLNVNGIGNAIGYGNIGNWMNKDTGAPAGGINVDNEINQMFRTVLGRDPSADEFAQWKAYAYHNGTGDAQVRANLDNQVNTLRNSGEAAQKTAATQAEQKKATVKSEFDSRAPLRASYYDQLQGVLGNQLMQGTDLLKSTLNQRGLLDSGSLERGISNLGIANLNAGQQGATAIQNEDYSAALGAGQDFQKHINALELGQQGINANQNLQNQRLAYDASNQPAPQSEFDRWLSRIQQGTQIYSNLYGGKK